MQIYGPYRVNTAAAGNVGGSTPAKSAGANRTADLTSARPTAAPVDQLDLSSSATGVNRLAAAGQPQAAESVAGGGEIRIDKVADLRRQIASGGYDTPERMDAALDRLFDSFG